MSVQLIKDKENEQQQTETNQPGSAFTSPTGAKPSPTGPVAPSAAQQTRAVQEAGPSKGTGFTGVGRYLQANVGSRLGEKVAGRVAQTGQQAATRLGQSFQQFQQQLGQQQQKFTEQQRAAQEALRKIASGELTDVSPEQQAAYAAIAGGQFQAPAGLTDIGDIQSQAQLATKLAQGTQTATGRAGLLQQVVGRGPQQYTKGKSALDALILGQAGGQLAAARRATAGLERQATTQEQLAGEKARQFGAELAGAKGALTGEATGIQKKTAADIAARQSQYTTDINALVKKIEEEVKTGAVSPETAEVLAQYGITPGTRIYDQDFDALARFLAVSKGPAEEVTATTKEEAARLEALKKLAGMGRTYTEEERQKIGTTIDPKTGLAISPEEFKSKFVSPGEQRITSAAIKAREIIPELKDYLPEGADFSPKTLEILENKKTELPKKATDLQNQLNQTLTVLNDPANRWFNDDSALQLALNSSDESQVLRAQQFIEARKKIPQLKSQLNRVQSQIPVLDNLLNEYNKGRTLGIKGSSNK